MKKLDLDENEIVRLYKSGVPTREIAYKTGYSIPTILRRLKENCVVVMTRYERLDLDEDEIVRLYESGINSRKVAKHMGCSQRLILNILNRCGVKLRNKGIIKAKIDIDEMIKMYNSGVYTGEIAKEFGCSDTTIRTTLKKHGINIRKPKEVGDIQSLTLIHAEEIGRLYGLGLSLNEISIKIGVWPSAIWQRLKKSSVEIRTTTNGLHTYWEKRHKNNPKINKAINLYQSGVSMEQVGVEIGISSTTVANILKRAGIKRRNWSEAQLTYHEMMNKGYLSPKAKTGIRFDKGRFPILKSQMPLRISKDGYPIVDGYELEE